jgi:hypothetical protein
VDVKRLLPVALVALAVVSAALAVNLLLVGYADERDDPVGNLNPRAVLSPASTERATTTRDETTTEDRETTTTAPTGTGDDHGGDDRGGDDGGGNSGPGGGGDDD